MIESQTLIREEFSSNLRRKLKERNISQQKLADALGVTQSSVSTWCIGSRLPHMDRIDQICKYLNVSRADLLGFDDPTGYADIERDEQIRLQMAIIRNALDRIENLLKEV